MEQRGIKTERGDAYRERLKLQEAWDQAEAEAAAVAEQLDALDAQIEAQAAAEAFAAEMAAAEQQALADQAALSAWYDRIWADTPAPEAEAEPEPDLESEIRKLLVEPRPAFVATMHNGEAWYMGPTKTGFCEVYGWKDESGKIRGAVVMSDDRLVDTYTRPGDTQAQEALAGIVRFLEDEQREQERLEADQEQATTPRPAKLPKLG
jgi:hypothetical protein